MSITKISFDSFPVHLSELIDALKSTNDVNTIFLSKSTFSIELVRISEIMQILTDSLYVNNLAKICLHTKYNRFEVYAPCNEVQEQILEFVNLLNTKCNAEFICIDECECDRVTITPHMHWINIASSSILAVSALHSEMGDTTCTINDMFLAFKNRINLVKFVDVVTETLSEKYKLFRLSIDNINHFDDDDLIIILDKVDAIIIGEDNMCYIDETHSDVLMYSNDIELTITSTNGIDKFEIDENKLTEFIAKFNEQLPDTVLGDCVRYSNSTCAGIIKMNKVKYMNVIDENGKYITHIDIDHPDMFPFKFYGKPL